MIPVLWYFLNKDFCIVFFSSGIQRAQVYVASAVRPMGIRVGGKFFETNYKDVYGPDTDRYRPATVPIRARYEPYTDGCRPHTVRVWAHRDPVRNPCGPIGKV